MSIDIVDKGGRPPKVAPTYAPIVLRELPPENLAQTIERLAAEGRTKPFIARTVGTSQKILNRWMAEDPSLQWVFQSGRAQHEAECLDILMTDARNRAKPNINVFFILKNMHGWREGAEADTGSRVNITLNLPGAMNREDFMKTVAPSDG